MSIDHINSEKAEHQSTKYTFKNMNFSQDIQLEILKLSDGVKSYLIFSSMQENPLHSLVTLEVEGQKFQQDAHWLKGGQKLLLSDKMTNQLLAFLKEGKQINISVDEHQLVVQEESFLKAYEKNYGRKILNSSFLEPFER